VTAEFLTFPELLRHRAAHDHDLPAVISETRSLTYGELDAETRRFAAWLALQGVVKGSRVGLLAPNGVDWVVAGLAAIRIGAVLVPLSTFLKPRELNAQLAIAAVTHLILVEGFRGRNYRAELGEAASGFDAATGAFARAEDLPSLRAVWFWEEIKDARAGDLAPMAEALEERVRPADDLVIVFSSGSRGAPKGVIHTHGNALRAVQLSLEARCLHAGERLYIPMPFFWVGGFSQGLSAAMAAGATLLTEAEPDPTRTLVFLETHRVSLFRGWPEQAQALSRHPGFAAADLSSLKAGSLDGVLPAHLRARPGARGSLLGMTETFGTYSGARLDEDLPESAFGSCGKPLGEVEVRIVDPDTGAVLPAGETGVIQVRGPNLMRGIIGRSREQVFTPDRFYSTGDLGRLDTDGYLFFVGRADDLLKVKGVTVNPAEVETELKSVPGVRRALVVELPGEGGAAELGAVVLLEKDAGLGEADLAAAARKTLSAFKVPTRWALIYDDADIPVLPSGKPDKAGLQNLIKNSSGCDVRTLDK
jgi:acyl-CoA synthetase (AMP-forming)/AMP-acid ligase II